LNYGVLAVAVALVSEQRTQTIAPAAAVEVARLVYSTNLEPQNLRLLFLSLLAQAELALPP
jgi:hypothetical protein